MGVEPSKEEGPNAVGARFVHDRAMPRGILNIRASAMAARSAPERT
jgi:hypothetical protein